MTNEARTDPGQTQVPTRQRRMSEEKLARLKELEEWGVDLSLIASSLAHPPEQRLAIMLDRLELINALRRAMHNKKNGNSHNSVKADMMGR